MTQKEDMELLLKHLEEQTTPKKEDQCRLLRLLCPSTDEERAAYIEALVERGYATYNAGRFISRIPQSILDSTIEFYLKDEKFAVAAYFAERAGMENRAKELYVLAAENFEKKGNIKDAAEMVEKSRNVQKYSLCH